LPTVPGGTGWEGVTAVRPQQPARSDVFLAGNRAELAVGQRARITFHGEAGQRISVVFSGVTLNTASVSILNPDKTPLGPAVAISPFMSFLDPRTLGQTGTHTLRSIRWPRIPGA
jgi:hypothetical protein